MMEYRNIFKNIWKQKSVGIFLLLALILWYLNKLSNEYSADIEIPVTIVSDPKSGKWIENPDMKIKAHCLTDGGTIMTYRFGAVSRLVIPISYVNIERNDRYSYKINNSSLTQVIKSLKSELNISHIEDITRIIRISDAKEKKVPIISDIKVTYAPQHMNTAGKIILGLDSVTLRAPQIILDTIDNIRTKSITYENLSSSIESDIALIIPENVFCKENKVPYQIPVDRFTQFKFKTKVLSSAPTFIGYHSGGRGFHWSNYNGKVTVIPEEVTVFVNLPMSKNTKEKDIAAFIDFKKNQSSSKYEVHLAGIPEGSEIVAIEPRMVDAFKDIK